MLTRNIIRKSIQNNNISHYINNKNRQHQLASYHPISKTTHLITTAFSAITTTTTTSSPFKMSTPSPVITPADRINTPTYANLDNNIHHHHDLNIQTIRCFEDNNCYVLQDSKGYITLVDPADAEPVERGLKVLGIDLNNPEVLDKVQIITTHHHWDHSQSNPHWVKRGVKKIVSGRVDGVKGMTLPVDHLDVFNHGEYQFVGFHTPGHTKGHLCVFFYKANEGIVNVEDGQTAKLNDLTQLHQVKNHAGMFTGDCLFSSGAGRFFEGTAIDMFPNMSLFYQLPEKTMIFDGHEYTKSNLNFASKVDQHNDLIHNQLDWIATHNNIPTHPTTIGLEKKINIFMRAKDAETLGVIRARKDKNAPAVMGQDVWRKD